MATPSYKYNEWGSKKIDYKGTIKSPCKNKAGFEITTGQMALLANQIAAFCKSANQRLCRNRQFESASK